ncbi:MAG: Hpt domain-containing protein [Bacteroidetes bacterium]|nr:Hpt domain-containing protein [Bacteroidota bacterium]
MEPLIDFSYLNELSGGDSKYLYELLNIFLDSTPAGIITLDELIQKGEDWEAIWKQAHFLKSSAGIVRVRGLYAQLLLIEQKGRKHEGLDEIKAAMAEIKTTFNEAHKILIEEKEKHKKLAGITDDAPQV